MATDFFTTIVELAHERVLTADDFTPFVGRSNWLSFDKGEELGNCDAYPDAKWLSGVVYPFHLIGTLKHSNIVLVDVELGPNKGYKRIQMAPDELAIRMDES